MLSNFPLIVSALKHHFTVSSSFQKNTNLLLQDSLCKHLMNIIQRTISAAKQQPTELVTSLRIIEREERYAILYLN